VYWEKSLCALYAHVMESNKDESQKCLRIAQAALASGNIEKAKKFLAKSNKLFPLKAAEGIKVLELLQ